MTKCVMDCHGQIRATPGRRLARRQEAWRDCGFRTSPAAARLLGIVALLTAGGQAVSHADQGMWTFDNIPRESVLERYGFAVTDEWLDKVRLGAVRIGYGSGSFVSADGLILTCRHVVEPYLYPADASRMQPDGFLARARSEEFRLNVKAEQLIGIEDVTARVRSGIPRADADGAAIKAIEAEWLATQDASVSGCQVVKLYNGHQYHLYKYRVWNDVRLAFAPEQAAREWCGKDGTWPRYGFDVGLMRVWENGAPASTPNHFRLKGIAPQAGELLFIAMHPRDHAGPEARVRRTVAQLERMGYPAAIVRAKSVTEDAVRARVAANPEWQASYGDAWETMAEAQKARERLANDPKTNPQAWQETVAEPEQRAAHLIAEAYFAVYGTSAGPDATWTLRFGCGVPKPYEDTFQQFHRGGQMVTTIGDAFDAAQEIAAWQLPSQWSAAGTRLARGTPLNFVTTHDTYGGASGSPILNAALEVVGVHFDRNVYGARCAAAGVYDETMSRAIHVSAAAILEMLTAAYGANALVSELAGE